MCLLIAIALALGVPQVQAESLVENPMISKGTAIFENCMACHGERAMRI